MFTILKLPDGQWHLAVLYAVPTLLCRTLGSGANLRSKVVGVSDGDTLPC